MSAIPSLRRLASLDVSSRSVQSKGLASRDGAHCDSVANGRALELREHILAIGLESEVRNSMAVQQLESLALYPEEREASRPTTGKILDLFERVRTYAIVEDARVVEEFKDELTDTQKVVLACLAISENDY